MGTRPFSALVTSWRALLVSSLVGLAAVAFAFLTLIYVLDRVYPPPLSGEQRVAGISSGTLLYDREGVLLHARPAQRGYWRFQIELSEIDPSFVETLIDIEDKRFFAHNGVDVVAIGRAAFSSIVAGRIVSGASTITMQTARLLDPRPRTLSSKCVEMFRAWQIERRLTKQEILELYLRLTPYGGNIEGIKAASLIYFGKEPLHLSEHEQALLIALPQAPEVRRPDRFPRNTKIATDRILKGLSKTRTPASDNKQQSTAYSRSVPERRRLLPRLAYHAALLSSEQSSVESSIFRSTLDYRMQTAVEHLIREVTLSSNDGANAAAVVANAETGEVLAYIGSGGFDTDGGWLDLAQAKRSPGSTLKPFIYALAFDDGRLSPTSVLDDRLKSFDDYLPENFDRRYHGHVRVSDALRHSLNVPAVEVLSDVGANRLGTQLRFAGTNLASPTSRRSDHPGLPMALGGVGVSLFDLTVLYAGIERGGHTQRFTFQSDRPVTEHRPEYQIMSDKTARQITSILETSPPPPGRAPSSLQSNGLRVAYKTGTSFGFRDAFAVGSSGGITVGVWIGRPDGAPRPQRTGRNTAAPVLFDIFDAAGRIGIIDGETDKNVLPTEEPLRLRDATQQAANDPAFVISYPHDGAELFWSEDGIEINTRQGDQPIRWYANGQALDFDEKGPHIWSPERGGQFELVAVDASGRSDVVNITLVRE
ncbi:MAG: penicillin-binding protein 1C [Pseudomonadota bacterium]